MRNTYKISSDCATALQPYTQDLSPNYHEAGKTELPQTLVEKYNLPVNAYEIGAILHASKRGNEYANLNP